MGFVSVMIDSYERGRDVRHRRPGRRDVGGFTDAARADHETIAPTALGGTRTKDRVGAPVRGYQSARLWPRRDPVVRKTDVPF